MSVPKRMIGFCIAIVVIAAGVALVAGGWFSSTGGRQVAEQPAADFPVSKLLVDRSAVGQSLVDEKNASQPQPAAAAGSRDAAVTNSEDSEEKPSIKIPLAKLPGFGKQAKSPDKAEAGNLIRSGEIAGDTGKTSGIVTGSVGKVEHLYKPAPPLEVERKKAEATIKAEEDTVKIVTGFECSTPLEIEKISPTHFRVKITTDSKLRNWFMFRVEGAKGKTVRIDIKDAPLNKWWSLNPVWSSLASIDDPATFHKITSDKKYPAKQAYNGPHLPDTSQQNWHYISDVWMEDQRLDRTGTFCFVSTYESDGVFLAMRAPYTVKYNEAYVKSLEGKPGVKVIEVGKSKEGRPLQVVQIGEGDPKKVPCIVMYAREHGSEHDSSWPVSGGIERLSGNSAEAKLLRSQFTFLFIPMVDADGAAASQYEVITQKFVYDGDEGPEARAFAGFFRKWVEAGNRLDLTIDLHNVESAEGPHLFCPVVEPEPDRTVLGLAFHEQIIAAFKAHNYLVQDKPRGSRTAIFRLGGYLGLMYGPLFMPYEVNSQEQNRHLAVAELREMGTLIASASTDFLNSPTGEALIPNIVTVRERQAEWVRKHEAVLAKEPVINALQIEWYAWTRRRVAEQKLEAAKMTASTKPSDITP